MSYQIEQTILLRDYLKELPISQAMIKRIKREGDFLVNGKSQTVRCLLQKGDCLEIIYPNGRNSSYNSSEIGRCNS